MIQQVIEWKTIPFHLQGVHESSNMLLWSFARCTGRTVLVQQHTLTPKDGKVVLCVYKCLCSTQISVHLRFLLLWGPIENNKAVVIKGPLLGSMGVVKLKVGSKCVVAFQVDHNTVDYSFEEDELASLEDLKE